jgi:hypothetical protein
MSISTINWLNVLFMILAAIAAVNLPFETFLFSYAILGPLHYFTEINWLNSRNYFIKSPKTILVKSLVIVILICLVVNSLNAMDFYIGILKPFKSYPEYEFFNAISNPINSFYLFIALCSSFAFIISEKWYFQLTAFISCLAGGVSYYILKKQSFEVFFTLFLPTIVHVWIFTGLFIMLGAVKSKSFSAWVSLFVYILVSYLMFDINHNIYTYQPSSYVKESFLKSNFQMVTTYIHNFFFEQKGNPTFMLNSNIGLQIQSLIAFAYTYHYLNWFSKTSIIKWHEIDKIRLVSILILWVISFATYAVDYKMGLAFLYFISVLHVILEFPLNILAIKEIFVSVYPQKN